MQYFLGLSPSRLLYAGAAPSTKLNVPSPSTNFRDDDASVSISKTATARSLDKTLSRKDLTHYINQLRNGGCREIDLSSFDLSNMDVKDIDFSLTVLSRANFDAIVSAGGSVIGARLLPGVDVTNLCFEEAELDHVMAGSLMDAGVEPKSVLIHYFASTATRSSDLYKAKLLNRYLDEARQSQQTPVDLSGLDLSDVLLTHLSFENTLLDHNNLSAMFASSADLRGARLANDVVAPPLHSLDMVKLDKPIAMQLIQSGANARAVLANYVATQHEQGELDVDIEGIDITHVSPRYLKVLSMNTSDIPLEKAPRYIAASKEIFKQDLLELLQLFTVLVSDVVKQSGTRDKSIRNTTHKKEWPTHAFNIDDHQVIIGMIQHHHLIRPTRVEKSIQLSAGDCGEMAMMCKSVLDLYLPIYLKRLGWDAPWKALYIKALPPSSHYVIEFEWTFAEQRESYIVDPWGKLVQPYDDAVAYFRKNSGNGYTHSNTTFGHTQLNTHLEEAAYLENIKTAFDRFNIKEQLDAKIKAHKYKFVGMPE